jgi:hypothetical protein
MPYPLMVIGVRKANFQDDSKPALRKQRLVSAAFERVARQETTRVITHPDQAAQVRSTLAAATTRNIEVVADGGRESGTLIFETTRGAVDASLDSQLREIENGLAESRASPPPACPDQKHRLDAERQIGANPCIDRGSASPKPNAASACWSTCASKKKPSPPKPSSTLEKARGRVAQVDRAFAF